MIINFEQIGLVRISTPQFRLSTATQCAVHEHQTALKERNTIARGSAPGNKMVTK